MQKEELWAVVSEIKAEIIEDLYNHELECPHRLAYNVGRLIGTVHTYCSEGNLKLEEIKIEGEISDAT